MERCVQQMADACHAESLSLDSIAIAYSLWVVVACSMNISNYVRLDRSLLCYNLVKHYYCSMKCLNESDVLFAVASVQVGCIIRRVMVFITFDV